MNKELGIRRDHYSLFKILDSGFTLIVDFFKSKKSFITDKQSDMSVAPGGFTLIEILVTMTIAGVLFAGGYAAYQDFSRRQALDNAYKELRTNLNLARQLAISGEKLPSCTSPLSGYRVDFYSTHYTLSAVCGVTIVASDIPLPSGITVSGTSGFMYKALAQGTSLDSSVDVTLTQALTNTSIQATLSKEGILER